MLGKLTPATLPLALLSSPLAGQDANAVIASAAKTMGVDNLTSITCAGTARNGAFGQSKNIGEPMGAVNLTRINKYTRTINFGPAADAAARLPAHPPTPGRTLTKADVLAAAGTQSGS